MILYSEIDRKDSIFLFWMIEVYEHLIFDGCSTKACLRYPDLLERSFVCFSFGKTITARMEDRLLCCSRNIMAEFRKIHHSIAFSVVTARCNLRWRNSLQQKENIFTAGWFPAKKAGSFCQPDAANQNQAPAFSRQLFSCSVMPYQ